MQPLPSHHSANLHDSFNKLTRATTRIIKSIRKSIITFIFYIPAAATFASKEARKKIIEDRRELRRQKKEEKKQMSWFDEDFWESHVAHRDKDYIVPPQNRVSVSRARMKRLEDAQAAGKFEVYARSLGLGVGGGGRK
jgi:hypothetical protein